MVKCECLSNGLSMTNQDELVWIGNGLAIKNDRNEQDWVGLDQDYWEGMKQGMDGYPDIDKNGDFMLGGVNRNFKPIGIEFYTAIV